MKVSCFRDGLPKSHPLTASLVKKPPRDYNDLSDRLEKYILLEENDRAHDSRNGSPPRRRGEQTDEGEEKGKGNGKKKSNRSQRNGNSRDNPKERERKGRGERGNPSESINSAFNMPIGKVMSRIKEEEYFQWPRPLRGEPNRRNQKLRCAYHRDVGHTTDNCRTLQFHLNELAEKGYLRKYLKEDAKRDDRGGDRRQKRHRSPELEEDFDWHKKESRGTVNAVHTRVCSIRPRSRAGDGRWEERRHRGTISAIHGVVRRNRAHQRTQRAEVHSAAMAEQVVGFNPKENLPSITTFHKDADRSEIGFSNADLVGLDIPHNDALVINLNIDTWDVHKVLVDPGSSTEIMYYNLFQKIQPAEVREMEFPIYSFSGQAIFPIGVTTLTVRAGPVAKRVDFVIIGEESPYMAILGRTWLNDMKAVASPYHQKLKFPCSRGIVTVKGSQQEARICFGQAIRSALTEVRPEKEGSPERRHKLPSLTIREPGEITEERKRKDKSSDLSKNEGKRSREE